MMMNMHASREASDGTDGDAHKTPSRPNVLLPPIELQPPSPPRHRDPDIKVSTSAPIGSTASGMESLLTPSSSQPRSSPFSPLPTISGSSSPSPTTPSSSVPTPTSPSPVHSPTSTTCRSPGSPGQVASLGRSTVVNMTINPGPAGSIGVASGSNSVPRRNSLGDLKIPARISQAQVSQKRDLGMVREFASNIEREFLFFIPMDSLRGRRDEGANRPRGHCESGTGMGMGNEQTTIVPPLRTERRVHHPPTHAATFVVKRDVFFYLRFDSMDYCITILSPSLCSSCSLSHYISIMSISIIVVAFVSIWSRKVSGRGYRILIVLSSFHRYHGSLYLPLEGLSL